MGILGSTSKVLTCAIATALLVAGGISSVSATEVEARKVSPTPSPEETGVNRVYLDLDHGLNLMNAEKVAAGLSEEVVGYRFENGNVVGEYSPDSSLSHAQFLELFLTDYGTEPLVTQLVVEREASSDDTGLKRTQIAPLGADLPAASPPAVEYGGGLLDRNKQTNAAKSAPAAATLAASPDWRPDQTNHGIFAAGGTPFFGQQFTWQGNGLQTNLPSNVGLEFEINQVNNSVFAPYNKRPACFDNQYKDRHWAKNYNYTWIATDWFGSSSAAAMGAYADYNDLSDACGVSSIAVGLREPKALTSTGGAYAMTTLDLVIYAPAGLASSVAFSGNVQAVSEHYCTASSLGQNMSNTDCMGVTEIQQTWAGYPAGTYNRGTLNITNGWTLPMRCWSTDNKGLSLYPSSCYSGD